MAKVFRLECRYTFMLQCPKCRSEFLMIRQKTGFERIKVFFTGLREYLCRDCDQRFRAEDRRKHARDEKSAAAKQLA